MKLFFLLFLFLFLSIAVSAETKQQPASCQQNPQFRQFDFWIGEWNVFEKGKLAGTSSIQLILDQCVIFENWNGQNGYNGKSLNIFDQSTNKWRQFWVDNRGGLLTFSGEYKDGKLVYEGESTKDSHKTLQRMTFLPLNQGRVSQLWEQSEDGGKTWRVAFDGEYRPKK